MKWPDAIRQASGSSPCWRCRLAGAGVAGARAQDAPFYKDKSIRFIISAGVAGGYVSYARLLAQHMGNHIPGKPDFIVQSMPGAGGLLATNYLYAQAPQDGTTIGLIHSTVPLAPLFGMAGRALRSAEDPLARQHGPLRRPVHRLAHVADQDLAATCSTRSSSSAPPASARRWSSIRW